MRVGSCGWDGVWVLKILQVTQDRLACWAGVLMSA